MSPQLLLAYRASYVGEGTWKAELEALRTAVNYLGLKEVAPELDVSVSALSDAMNERDRKRWAGEWTHVVIGMLVKRNDELAHSIIRAIQDARIAPSPDLVVEETKTMTPEQRADALERELAAMGSVGEKAISRALRKNRR